MTEKTRSLFEVSADTLALEAQLREAAFGQVMPYADLRVN